MFRFFQRFIVILMLGALSSGCGLIPVAEDVLGPLELYVSIAGNDANDCLGPEPGRACLTLQAALDKSRTHLNSTVNIGPGQYYVAEDPATPARADRFLYELTSGVTLIGAGQDQTIFHSNKWAYTFGADSSIPVVIRGLGIDASNGAYGGINVHGRADISIENCRVYYGKLGILVQDNGIAKITNSLIEQSQTGIQILGGLALVSNDLVISGHDTGISIERGGSAHILRTVIEKNVIGILNNGDLRLVGATFTHNITSALVNSSGQANDEGSTFDSNGYLDVRPSSSGRGSSNPTISNSGEMNLWNSTISNNFGQAVLNNSVHFPHRNATGNPVTTYEMTLDRVQVFGNENGDSDSCAVVNQAGALGVMRSNIQGNHCVGVDVYGGETDISHSSIFDNRIGIFARGELSVGVYNTTITKNRGFGIEQVEGARLKLVGVTVARQSTGLSSSFDPPANLVVVDLVVLWCNAAVVGLGEFVCNESWTEDNLGLGPLTAVDASWFEGGFSLGFGGVSVIPLLPGSPLIDAGIVCSLEDDQRGALRPRSHGCDVGAYELQISSATAPLEFVTPSGGVPGVIPLYTDTPQVPTPIILTFTKNAFCRKGPGTLYRDISGFQQGDTAQADGRNATDPRWWWVLIPNSTDHCWISYATVETNNLAEGLPVQTVSLGLPGTPASFAISARTCSKNGFSLKLVWNASAGAEGYTLYRNSKVIATFKANGTVYQDNPPVNKSLTYELEAFNSSGFSERLVVEDGGCK